MAVKREDVPMVLGFCSSKEEGFGREDVPMVLGFCSSKEEGFGREIA